MKQKTYMVLLVDRRQATMFTLRNGSVGKQFHFRDDQVPQKVKHGDDTWDAQNKIFRHIEDHLHRYLVNVGKKALAFAESEDIDVVLIGGHRTLFPKIEKHLPYPLDRKVVGGFITEMKIPFNNIIRRALLSIEKIEEDEVLEQLQRRLHGE